MTSKELSKLQCDLNSAVNFPRTKSAHRIKTIAKSFKVEFLNLDNIYACEALDEIGFKNEPLGTALGDVPVDEDLIQSFRETLDFNLSFAIFDDSKVIALLLVNKPKDSFSPVKPFTCFADRLEAAFFYIDQKAKGKYLGPAQCLDMVAVHENYRGLLQTQSEDSGATIFQRMLRTLHVLCKKNNVYGLYSHSNNVSAPRQVSEGWKVILSIPYTELDNDIVIDRSIIGRLHFCYINFQ